MTDYYIDPVNGDNSNSGESINQAFADFDRVNSTGGGLAEFGPNRIFLRGARETAPIEDEFQIYRGNNQDSGLIELLPVPGEKPVIANGYQGVDFRESSNFRMAGIEIRNMDHMASIFASGNGNAVENITVENCHIHHYGLGGNNGDGVFFNQDLSRGLTVRGCTFHDGMANGNSDGINISTGAEDVLIEDCHGWFIADDFVDYNSSGADEDKIIRRCSAGYIGYDRQMNNIGDGNGFKVLGSDTAGTATDLVTRCISYNNYRRGYKTNADPSGDERLTRVLNCTSYGNGQATGQDGYEIRHVPGEVKNCISHQDGNEYDFGGADIEDVANTWNLGIADPLFRSTEAEQSGRPYGDEFLRLAQDSPCIDAGVALSEINHRGEAPDVGAFEYGGTVPKGGTPRGKNVWTGSSWVTLPS